MDTSETYRRLLRVSTVVMAAVLLFQSGLLDQRSTALFSQTADYLQANVGMSASVAPTELNTITAQLTQQQTLLAQREAAIEQREIAVNLNTGGNADTDNRTTYLLAAVLFIQLVLIVLNYGLDFLRTRETQPA